LSNRSEGADQYRWHFDEAVYQGEEPPNPVRFSRPGSHTIQLTASRDGCQSRDTLAVRVKGIRLGLPSAFSPNQDGLNEVWEPQGPSSGLAGSLRIYNRWGKLVHRDRKPPFQWRGNCGGSPCPEGVYTFTLQLRPSGQQISRRGTITLVR
jgi:gliding motility-associated-like protein